MSELAGLPESIGRYRVVGLLGRGGMGRVVRARDAQLQRDVALKLVETSLFDAEDVREARFMFHREARALACLKHPNIIEVYEYSGPEASLPFIVCELVEAPTLRDILDERGITLEARVAAALAFELALALEHAHAKGIVHRDLKPENVFWSATGRAVLADFGIAKALGDARFASTLQFGSTNLYGSPSYMAPEQVRGGKVDERTDLHGLGCLLFEVLSGAPPYVGATVEELLGRVERGEHEPVERTLGPPALVQLVEELIASAASDRPASASLVVARLRGVLDDLGVRDPRDVLARLEQSGGTRCATDRLSQSAVLDATRFVPHLRQHSQNWLVVSAGLALLVAAGLTAWLLVKPEPSVRPVAVTFVLPGEADLTIDGHAEGPVRDVQRVVLAPGRHAVEAHIYASGETIRREIFVVRGGSGAQFEF